MIAQYPKITQYEYDSIVKLCRMISSWGQNNQIRGLAAEIISAKNSDGSWQVKEYDHIGTVESVYAWVNDQVRYTPDPIKIDIFEDPLTTLGLKIADCDGYLILIGSLLQSIGFPVCVAMSSQSETERLSHVYLLVGIPPKNPPKNISSWIPIDAITNQPVTWQPPLAWGIWRRV